MTKNTGRLLEVLDAARSPVAVADLARAMEGVCDLATLYRTLRRLESTGLLESFAFECRKRGIERYWQRRSSTHRHFFHCESCHRFLDVGACRLSTMTREVERDLGAEIQGHTLYFTGTCKDCRSSLPAPGSRRG